MWVDLGLVNLVDAVMNGPQTLYEMPEGSFLASIRFTDDPDTVNDNANFPWTDESNTWFLWVAFGTEKSFGWNGFAGIGKIGFSDLDNVLTYDTLALSASQGGYGPFAAIGTGYKDLTSLVLSAASVGPIQAALLTSYTSGIFSGLGARVGPISAWVADTHYDSPADNTVATPGALSNCVVLANGTVWLNENTGGTSGGTSPDFAGNAGGSVSDGPDIIWFDTGSAPPTVGAVHVFAEIIMPVVSASPGSIYASVVKKGSVTVAVKNKGNIVANVIQ